MKLRALGFSLIVVLAACEGGFGGKPSKMAAGQLYEAGDPKYDGFLKKVHEEQVAAAEWADQSKGARKPITHALNLPPNASNSAIIEAAKAKKNEGSGNSVHGAAEETAALERSFLEKQKVNAERLDKLANDGAELKKQATEDRRNMGADKADPAKVDKKEEIKREVSAAAEIAANLRDDAKKGAQEAEALINALKKELGIVGDGTGVGKNDDDKDKKDDEKSDGKKTDGKKGDGKKNDKKPDPKPAPKKPAEAKPVDKASEDKPAPAPTKKPAEKPAENEVFNP